MNTEKRIALACFLGATTGTIAALFAAVQFGHGLWILGPLLGGCVSYLSYEFSNVLQALGDACREIRSEYHSGFFLTREKLTNLLRKVVWLGMFALWLVLIPCTGFCWVLPVSVFVFGYTEVSVGLICALSLMSFMLGLMLNLIYYRGESDKIESLVLKDKFVCLINTNPIPVVCRWLPRRIIWCVVRIPKFLRLLCRVAKRVFIRIHSEMRLLCFTDGLIGGTAGYLFRGALSDGLAGTIFSVILGGAVGAVCGILNYRLVSIRWLKLVKA